jgi:hypothetical protein
MPKDLLVPADAFLPLSIRSPKAFLEDLDDAQST